MTTSDGFTSTENDPPLLKSSGGIAYLTKDVLKLQLQLSPGSRMAAAGFSSQRMEPPSGLGRLCHGSMHTNLGSPPAVSYTHLTLPTTPYV